VYGDSIRKESIRQLNEGYIFRRSNLKRRLSKMDVTKRFPCRSNAGPSSNVSGLSSIITHGSALMVGSLANSGGKGTRLFSCCEPEKPEINNTVSMVARNNPRRTVFFMFSSSDMIFCSQLSFLIFYSLIRRSPIVNWMCLIYQFFHPPFSGPLDIKPTPCFVIGWGSSF